MNKYVECVYVISEDDADRQIADGFVLHPRVKEARIQVLPPAGGWPKVLETFRDEYIPVLRAYPTTHVVMLIDFDNQVDRRKADFEREVPAELETRVFVIGSKHTPETLRKQMNKSFEEIGSALAEDCGTGTGAHWAHEQLSHNDMDRQRLHQAAKPFLF
jgi:hypothetical protein